MFLNFNLFKNKILHKDFDFLIKSEFFLISSVIYALISFKFKFISYLLFILIFLFFFKIKKGFALIILISILILINFNGFLILYPYQNGKHINKTVSAYLSADKDYDAGTILFCKSKPVSKYKYKLQKEYFAFKLPIISSILNFRNDFSEKIFNLSGGEITLLQALLFGNKYYLSNDLKDKFTIMGLNHFLAVSGMHVGLILLILYNIFFFLPNKIRKIIIIILILPLIPIAGFKIPVIRAVCFATIIMFASIIDIKTDLKKLLMTLAGFFILLSPGTVKQPSFLLSFVAVYGILFFLEKDFSLYLSIILTGIVATAFTLPFTTYFFGTYNILSIFDTILLLPFIYLELCLSIFSLFFLKISINPLILFENIINGFTNFLFNFSHHFFVLNKMSLMFIVLSILIILMSVYFKKVYFLIPLLLFPYMKSQNTQAIYFPSFSRAKAVIQTGEKNKIFYLGDYKTFRYKLIPFLAELKINNFDEGKLKIFGGKNYFLKVSKKLTHFNNLCINTSNNNCSYVFMTKSNKLNGFNIDNEKKYIVYKNKFKADNIYELKYAKLIKIENGKIFYENKAERKRN